MVSDLNRRFRSSCSVIYRCDRFVVRDREFEHQYEKFYNSRYEQMKEWVLDSAHRKWGDKITVIPLNELMANQNKRVCIVGVLLKIMKLQPSVLNEYSEDLEKITEPPPERFTSDTDVFSLQDTTENVVLVGGPDPQTHVTGIMIAVMGHEQDNGNKFVVDDFCYPTPCPQKPLYLATEDKYIMFCSDLAFALKCEEALENARNNLIDFLSGVAGDDACDRAIKVVRVIVAGNCIDEKAADQEKELAELEGEDEEDDWNKKEKSYTVEAVQALDSYLVRVGTVCPVDVMPGPFDPTSFLVPQQPLHRLLLPKSSKVTGVRCTTNPYHAAFDNIEVLGSSGRVVQSIYEMSTIDEPVNILQETIKWRHMMPTAPDTVPAYPFTDKDPFVMEERPHVYFAGNQKHFGYKMYDEDGKKTLIVAIPSFKSTQTCVLVNLRSLKCEVIAFNS